MHHILRLLLLTVLFTSCKDVATKEEEAAVETTPTTKTISKGDKIIADVVAAHGGDAYKNAAYSFVFRKNIYTFKNSPNGYVYGVSYVSQKDAPQDMLRDGAFTRTINGKKVDLSDKKVATYSQALNSVIYFATLPYKLQDASVFKKYKGAITINGKNYHTVEVRFAEEGGGQDFDDVYYYWINTTTNRIDFLAYSYHVNGGGVRFREAYNPRMVDGILFQDYINYKTSVDTALEDLPALYEAGELKELSRIKTENVKSIKS